MRGKWFAAGLLAAGCVLAWSGASRGGDTIRLNMVDKTPTQNLVDDGQGAETIRTWHRGFGFGGYGGWGYRGFGWGGLGYRGFGYGGLGYRGLGWGGLGWGGLGYRGFGWGGLGYGGLGWGGLGYRGFGWGGLYRPYYGFGLGGLGFGGLGYGLGFGGLGYGLGYGRFGYGLGFGGLGYGLGYGGLGYGIGYGGFFGPCSGAAANVYTLDSPPPANGQQMPGADGTFPYDGGPQQVVPNPTDTPPAKAAPRSVPLEGRSVSLPKAKATWSYPAYGETARRTTPASERTYLARGEVKKRDSR